MNAFTGIIGSNKINNDIRINEDLILKESKESNIKSQKELLTPELENGKTKDNQILFLNKKTSHLKIDKEKNNDLELPIYKNIKKGKWTKEESDEFFDAINKYGVNWAKIDSSIKTRTLVQIKSYASKIFHKFKIFKDEQLGIDFTEQYINNIKDMIYYIKLKFKNQNIKNVFEYLNNRIEIKQEMKNTGINDKDDHLLCQNENTSSQTQNVNKQINIFNNNNISIDNNLLDKNKKNNIIINNNININFNNYYLHNSQNISLIILFMILNRINVNNNNISSNSYLSNLNSTYINLVNSSKEKLASLKENNNDEIINNYFKNINVNNSCNNNNGRMYHIGIQIERDRHNFDICINDNIGQFIRDKLYPLTNNREVYLFYQGQLLNQAQNFAFYEHRLSDGMVILCKIRENDNRRNLNNNHYNDNMDERVQEQLRNDPRSVSIYSIFTHIFIIFILSVVIISYKKLREIFTKQAIMMIQFLCIVWALSFSNTLSKLIYYHKISC